MSIESLKSKARRHEQKEEWQKALEQYAKAIDQLDREDQPDSGLHNRVGDLYVKVGDYEQAIEHYDRAIELYRDTYLLNNAIAVCKKIVRHVPGRNEVFRTMGQIRAEQGFTSDARQNFLRYAELMQEAGDLDASFRALVEFADLVRDDVDVRITVADQMLANDRMLEGIEQLKIAYQIFKLAERDDRAFGLEARLLELDPDVDFDRLAAEAQEMAATADDGFEYITPFGDDEEDDIPAPVAEEEPAVQVAEETATQDTGDTQDVEGAEALGGALVDEPTAEAVSDAWEEAAGTEEEEADELPLMESPDEELADLPPMDDAVDAPDGDLAELPLMGDVDEDDVEEDDVEEVTELPLMERTEEEPADLPLMGDVEEEATELPLMERTEEEPADLPLMGDVDEEATELPLVESPEAAEDVEEAATELPVMDLGEGPEPLPGFNEEPTEVAEAAEESGAAASPAAPEGGSAAPEVEAPSDEYVDLSSMIFGDEPEEPKTTRFRVQYEEPSGDEAADFQKMLSQFKEKVSENLDATDVKAHYDLGTAYKEMGLLDEAIAEFQSALRASANHLPTYELMGQTFLEMGKNEAAVKSLERALKIPTGVEDELLGIYYYLARAYEALGKTEPAVEFYDRVFSLDINFADVTERLRALR